MTTLDRELLDIISKEYGNKVFTLKSLLNALHKHTDFKHSKAVFSSLSDLVKSNKLELTDTDRYRMMASYFNIDLRASTIKKPGPKTMPKGLSEKAKDEWATFYYKYKDVINNSAKPDDEEYIWKTAVAIFRNYCGKHNIVMLDDSHAITKADKDYMKNRLIGNKAKIQDKCHAVLQVLKTEGLLKRITKETLKPITHEQGFYVIPTELRCTLSKPYSSMKFKTTVKKAGFTNKGKYLEFTQGSHTIVVRPNTDDINSCIVGLTLYFTEAHVKYMVSSKAVTTKLVIQELAVLVKRELKKNNINSTWLAKISASLIPIN